MPRPTAAGRETALAEGLAALAARTSYTPRPGRVDFDELRRRWHAEGDPLPLNCINRTLLLVSYLRREGYGEDEVFAALGSVRRLPLVHAWTLVRGAQAWRWVEPEGLAGEFVRGERLLARHHLHVLFNDRRILLTRADKEGLLLAGERPRPRLVLFGRGEREVRGILAEEAFQGLLGELLDGRPAAERTGLARRAAAAGLLVAVPGGWAPGPRLVVVPAAAEAAARRRLATGLGGYLEVLAAAIPRLRQAFAATAAAGRYAWEEAVHAVLAGLLLDLGAGGELRRIGLIRRDCGETLVWAFGGPPPAGACGVQWQNLPRARGRAAVAQLWHAGLSRPVLALPPRALALLAALATGERPPLVPELLALRHLRLVRGTASGPALTFPVFLPADAARLAAAIAPAARRLVAVGVEPALRRVLAEPAWAAAEGDEARRHAAVRLVLEEGVTAALAAGLLPPLLATGEATAGWGRWLWAEEPGVASGDWPPGALPEAERDEEIPHVAV